MNMTTTAARTQALCIATTLTYGTANAAGISASPQLAVGDASHTYVVRYADLDLSRVEGATALYSRLRHAARIVCDPLNSREIGIAQKYRACMDNAVSSAVASVNRPVLSQYHQLRTKGDSSATLQLAKAD